MIAHIFGFRRALIRGGVVVSPDADMLFKDLPPRRQEKWVTIATTYVEVM